MWVNDERSFFFTWTIPYNMRLFILSRFLRPVQECVCECIIRLCPADRHPAVSGCSEIFMVNLRSIKWNALRHVFFPLCLHEASLNRLIQAGESITFASPVCIWALLWKQKQPSNSCSFHNEFVQNKCIISDSGHLVAITQRLSWVAGYFYVLYLIYCRPYIFFL